MVQLMVKPDFKSADTGCTMRLTHPNQSGDGLCQGSHQDLWNYKKILTSWGWGLEGCEVKIRNQKLLQGESSSGCSIICHDGINWLMFTLENI